MAQQTSVEWLENKFQKFLSYYEGNHKAEPYTIQELSNDFEQAKQMEEEEKKKVIVKSWQDGFDTGNYISTTTGGWNGDGEDYYNETYKQ